MISPFTSADPKSATANLHGLRPDHPDPATSQTIAHHGPWSALIHAVVEVRRYGQHCRFGRVDAATPDSQMAWIAANGNDSRHLIDKASGYELWISPAQLQRLAILSSTTPRIALKQP